MRKLALLFAALSLLSGVAIAKEVRHSRANKTVRVKHHLRHRKHARHHKSAVKGVSVSTAQMLLGDQKVEASSDFNPSTEAQAFVYTASTSGQMTDAEVYLGSGNRATKLIVGIYSNTSTNKLGSLLSTGSLASPHASAWNDVPLGSGFVTGGTKYWVAILGAGGSLTYRDTNNGATSYATGTGLRAMPATYPTETTWAAGPASVYVNGALGGGTTGGGTTGGGTGGPVAASNMVAPKISGTPQQGNTLTASTGTWSGTTPMTYSYKWSDGATGPTDTLSSSNIGQNVSVTVTASNSGGSGQATSASVGPVTATTTPVPPSNKSAPVVSGTPQQGDTLTASAGTWSGDTPMTYTYEWSDGTTGTADTLSSSDVGQNVSVTVTASNDAGGSSATSLAVGPVTASSSGSPGTSPNPGNGVSTNPSFFPIGVWLQTPESNAQNYANIGVNTFVGQSDGNDTDSNLSALQSAGEIVIAPQDQTGLADSHNGVIKAWLSQPDEPDDAQSNGSCLSTSLVVAQYNQIKAADSSRPVYLNFGRGVADTSWNGRGMCTGNTSMYPQYAQGADIVSFDIYPINEGYPISILATGVDNLHKWVPGKPVYAFVETTSFNTGDPVPTPAQIKAETWLELIHGANGIEYFCHILTPTFVEAGCLTLPTVKAQMQADDAQIQSLAPVLNSPIVTSGGATVSASVRVDTMTKFYGGETYVFSEAVDPNGGTATFSVPGASNGTVTVIGENRTLQMTNGSFTDTFGGYGVHLYDVDPPSSTPPPPPTPVPPSNTAQPQISGGTTQGNALTVSNGTWAGDTPMTYTYQWQDCSGTCTNISGATSASYTLTSSDVGKTVDAVVKATNDAGSATATSAQTQAVTATSPTCPSSTHNVPDGLDPWGGCFPGPQTSGVPSGTSLVNVSRGIQPPNSQLPSDNTGWTMSNGNVTLTSSNAVVDGVSNSGGLYAPNGTGGTVKNSSFGDNFDFRGSSLTLENSTVYGGSDTNYNAISNGGNGPLTVDGVNVSGGGHVILCYSGCTIKNSYVHDNAPSTTAHQNPILLDGGSNNVIDHNSVHCPTTSTCTGEITLLLNDGQQINETVENNLIMAASSNTAYCVYPGPNYPSAPHQVSGITWQNNVLQKGSNGHCDASFGESYGWNPSTCSPSPCTWTNNTYDDGTVWNP